MRAVVQRVSRASVSVDGTVRGRIGYGILALVGVARDDSEGDIRYIASKIASLRIFDDDAGKMNRSIAESGGAVLCVSQFTLHGDARKGRRPSYNGAAPPETANAHFDAVCERLQAEGLTVETGVFGAKMQVEMTGDGPVTVLLDSQKEF